MKRYLILSLLLLSCLVVRGAEPRGAELLSSLSQRMRTLDSYTLAFTVKMGDQTTQGSFTAKGDSYYMQLGDAEIYSDGKTRYEVNNRIREVTIDVMDSKSRNILNNPTRAFDLVGAEFVSELLWERDGQAAVKLTPRASQGAMSVMTVTLSTVSSEPRSVLYDFDGEQITIIVRSLSATKLAPKTFAKGDYADYEMIDFS